MHMFATGLEPIVYPDSDGQPMSDNTIQARWITTLFGNFKALYRDRADVFVAMDLLWYPVEGHAEVRAAPDVLVVFGRPKGERGSYMQWREDHVPVTVAIEVLSPGNTYDEMIDKLAFYEDHGVEEYYVYNPDTNRFFPHLRRGEMLRAMPYPGTFVSPRLQVRFVRDIPEMAVYYPDGTPFLPFEQVKAAWDEARKKAGDAEKRAGDAEKRAGDAEKRAGDAEKRAGDADKRAGEAEKRAARLAELSRKLLLQQATAEEADELRRLAEG